MYAIRNQESLPFVGGSWEPPRQAAPAFFRAAHVFFMASLILFRTAADRWPLLPFLALPFLAVPFPTLRNAAIAWTKRSRSASNSAMMVSVSNGGVSFRVAKLYRLYW